METPEPEPDPDPALDPTPRPGNFAPDAGAPRDFNVTAEIPGQFRGVSMVITKTMDVRRIPKFLVYAESLGFVGDRPPLVWDRTADGAPICPKHRVPMRKREKQGDEWHSHAVTDSAGEVFYCRGYRGRDSLGFDVDEGGAA